MLLFKSENNMETLDFTINVHTTTIPPGTQGRVPGGI